MDATTDTRVRESQTLGFPTFGILFWFYKDADTCANRIALLRRYNPGVPIYGLYGGSTEGVTSYASRLGPLLDDFCACLTDMNCHWKWRNGDLLIAEWFRQRGHELPWDTVFIAQWDMLVLEDVRKTFSGLRRGELYLSGLRPVRE